MKKNLVIATAVLLSVMLLSPMALANVYVPPGPYPNMAAWITPTLMVIDTADMAPVGWMYSDGPMYDNVAQEETGKIEKEHPVVIGKEEVFFSTEVVVFGWIPKLYVSPDQVPPPVEIVITWNGVPYVVTLTLDTQVGWLYPPELHPDQPITYEFAFPAKTEAHFENAFFNIWVGDIDDVRDDPNMTFDLPAEVDFPFGYYFWYIFHPNAGDFISFDCQPGKIKHPPTYDITALFEYRTSQIWFPHIAFDVLFLDVHKTITPNPISAGITHRVFDEIRITNLGEVAATELDITQTFPQPHGFIVFKYFKDATAEIVDVAGNTIESGDLPGLGTWPYLLPDPFDTLLPEETLIITIPLDVTTPAGWNGTIVFDLEVSAAEIHPSKYPRSMDGLIVISDPLGVPGALEPLWWGYELVPWMVEVEPEVLEQIGWNFTLVPEWFVPQEIIRMPIPQRTIAEVGMTLDPVPVDLNGDGKINAQDVALVRQAIVGLLAYNPKMDINVNGKIDTQDLAAYKLVAG